MKQAYKGTLYLQLILQLKPHTFRPKEVTIHFCITVSYRTVKQERLLIATEHLGDAIQNML